MDSFFIRSVTIKEDLSALRRTLGIELRSYTRGPKITISLLSEPSKFILKASNNNADELVNAVKSVIGKKVIKIKGLERINEMKKEVMKSEDLEFCNMNQFYSGIRLYHLTDYTDICNNDVVSVFKVFFEDKEI